MNQPFHLKAKASTEPLVGPVSFQQRSVRPWRGLLQCWYLNTRDSVHFHLRQGLLPAGRKSQSSLLGVSEATLPSKDIYWHMRSMENRKTWTSKNWIPPASFKCTPSNCLVQTEHFINTRGDKLTFCNDFLHCSFLESENRPDPSLMTLGFHLEKLQTHPLHPNPLKFSFAGQYSLSASSHPSLPCHGVSRAEVQMGFLHLLRLNSAQGPRWMACNARMAMSISKHTVLPGKFTSTWDSQSASSQKTAYDPGLFEISQLLNNWTLQTPTPEKEPFDSCLLG